ncbi:MAG: hypothetical protein ACTSQJ_19455 [Promethearchaeota archaeon]
MVKSKFLTRLISEIFIARYFIDFFKRPKGFVTRKEFWYTIWGRVVEVPLIATLWGLSKLPLIGPPAERTLAQIFSKHWRFKPIPQLDSLSKEALEYKAEKTLEINKKIDLKTKILDITTLNELIDKFPFSHVSNCGCRAIIRNCDAPMPVCLTVRWVKNISENIPDNSKYQKCSREELEKAIDLSDKYALVHMTLNYPDIDHPYHICGCCDCCCIGFREVITHGVPMMVSSKFVAKIDPKKCVGCFYCINFRCRFRAILKVNEDGTVVDPKKEDKERIKIKWPKWSENRKGWGRQIRKDPPSWEKIKESHSGKWFAKVDPNRCFGCGNCASPKYGCPQGAIKLYPRKKN